MSAALRAATWEISESEDECDIETKTQSVAIIVEPLESDDTSSHPPASTDEPRPGLAPLGEPESRPPSAPTPSAPTPTPSAPTPTPSAPTPTPSAPTPSRSRTRRSREQIQADQHTATQKREAREERRAARAREQEQRKREQQQRKELAEHARSLRPENCLKTLAICIDPAVLQHGGSDILLDSLSASGRRFVIQRQTLPQAVFWTRDLTQPGEDGRGFVEEDQVSWVLDLTDFIDVVISVKEVLQGNEDPPRQSLLAVLLEFLNRNSDKVVTMLVLGSPVNSATAWSSPSLQAEMGMDDLDMEEVMVYLQLYRNTSVVFFRNWRDITEHLAAVSKALSKRPSRRLTEGGGLSFCVDGPWASGVRVERGGAGLLQVWNRQVQQLNRVSVAVATAVTAAHPSPHVLLQAYSRSESEEHCRKLLADVPVMVDGKRRRVGPDISSRIYRCLSELNPEMCLD